MSRIVPIDMVSFPKPDSANYSRRALVPVSAVLLVFGRSQADSWLAPRPCPLSQRPRGDAPRRALLPPWRFLHRPLAAGRPRRDHARARRPRARRPRSLPRGSGVVDGDADASRRHRPHRAAVRRDASSQRRRGEPASRRSRAGIGAGAHRASSARSGSCPATTTSRASATTRASATRPARPFEPVRCDCFITESTFGLPIYRWPPQARCSPRSTPGGAPTPRRAARACSWATPRQGAAASCRGRRVIGPIVVHGAVETVNRAYRAEGVDLPPTLHVDEIDDPALLAPCLVVAPPSAQRHRLARRFGDAQRRLCQRLDAAARHAPSPRRRPRLRAVATMPTGRGCCAPSRPPARSASSSPTATKR